MPTIPLYNPAAPADDSHQVSAPGGYERWHFDAEDPEHDRQIIAGIAQGYIYHPGYLRAYARYRRMPTWFKPPLPRDYSCVYFFLYEAGRIAYQFATHYPCAEFAAQDGGISIGPNRFTTEQGIMKLDLLGTPIANRWHGRRPIHRHKLHAQFAFTPRLPALPEHQIFLSRRLTSAEHRWFISAPLSDVRGSILCGDDSIDFRGRAYHDHTFGTGPIGPGLRRWLSGRILFPDAAITFHYAQPRDRAAPEEFHIIEADMLGMRDLAVSAVDADWSRSNRWLVKYPARIGFDNLVELKHPRVIESSPFRLRLLYDALVRQRQGVALCELIYPDRLRWPGVSRMIERSIIRG